MATFGSCVERIRASGFEAGTLGRLLSHLPCSVESFNFPSPATGSGGHRPHVWLCASSPILYFCGRAELQVLVVALADLHFALLLRGPDRLGQGSLSLSLGFLKKLNALVSSFSESPHPPTRVYASHGHRTLPRRKIPDSVVVARIHDADGGQQDTLLLTAHGLPPKGGGAS